MKPFLKVLFQPTENRHYSGKKIAFWQEILNFSLPIVICIVGMVGGNTKAFAIILGILLVYMIADYFVLDALSDKLAWKFFWSRFYPSKAERETYNPDQAAMKQFDSNPSKQNYEKLQEEIKEE